MLRNRLLAASRNRKGFTLIELLVVVLILAILMAVALPLYLSAVADSQKKTCRANMQTIANAVQAARVKSGSADFTAFIVTAAGVITAGSTGNVPDLNAMPICPNGGTYTIVNGTSTPANTSFKVSCSLGGATPTHGTFEPGVDHN
jgi:type IV pilus assembly protein PilA